MSNPKFDEKHENAVRDWLAGGEAQNDGRTRPPRITENTDQPKNR